MFLLALFFKIVQTLQPFGARAPCRPDFRPLKFEFSISKNWKKYQGIDNVVSRRLFPCAHQRFPPVLAAYKSGRSAPAMDTQKHSSLLRRQNLPARR
jgi:hypothetical protein